MRTDLKGRAWVLLMRPVTLYVEGQEMAVEVSQSWGQEQMLHPGRVVTLRHS